MEQHCMVLEPHGTLCGVKYSFSQRELMLQGYSCLLYYFSTLVVLSCFLNCGLNCIFHHERSACFSGSVVGHTDTHAFTALVRKEIEDETDRETGRTKQISTVPIYLSIYSPNGKTTTLAMCWLSLYCLPLLLYHISIAQLCFCGFGSGLF